MTVRHADVEPRIGLAVPAPYDPVPRVLGGHPGGVVVLVVVVPHELGAPRVPREEEVVHVQDIDVLGGPGDVGHAVAGVVPASFGGRVRVVEERPLSWVLTWGQFVELESSS